MVTTSVLGVIFAMSIGCVDEKKEIAIYQKQLDALSGAAEPAPDDSPLTLQQAMRLAEKNDESLGISGETYLQALIAKDRAFSTFLPQISLGADLTEQQPVRGEKGPVHNFSVPLSADTNLFNGFRDEAAVEQAGATAEQNRYLLLSEQQTVLLDVVQTYYAVLQAERSVIVDRNSLKEQDERVRQAVAENRLGTGTLLTVEQSESQASATRVALIQAQTSVTTSRAMLGFLIGVPVGDRPLTDQYDPPAGNVPAVEDFLAQAYLHREDYVAAASAVEAARQGVRIAIGEYLPSITLNVNYLLYKETEPLVERLSGALSLNVPIFTGGQIEADVRTALSQLRSAVLSRSQTRKQVEEDVRTAYANLISSRDQVTELRVELQASREALVQAQRQNAVGLATNLDILTAFDTLLSTQLQLATQEYQRKINYLNLLRVTGILTFADASPTTRPSNEPNDLETTTPPIVGTPALP